LSRIYFVENNQGKERLAEQDFPLSIGGSGADLTISGFADNEILAHIALSDGHAYIQPAGENVELFHNHEHITASTWLKSGDSIQLGEQNLHWDVKGDQVFLRIRRGKEEPELSLPAGPPPESDTGSTDEIIPIVQHSMPPQRRRRLRQLVIAVFSLLSLTAIFVLFATPVTISISPEPDSWSLHGFPPPVPLGERLLAVPGNYTVEATRKGYQPFRQDIDVPAGGFQSFKFDLREMPGRISLHTDPEVAIRLSVDAIDVPLSTEGIALLERGARVLRIESDRYQAEELELEVTGFDILQEVNIPLRAAWATVTIESLPSGATVKLDDETIGTTPLLTEIIQGQRKLEYILAGYKTFHKLELFEAGTARELELVTLDPNDGELILTSQPAGATVSVDGNFGGATPVTLVLTSGVVHQLRLSKPGYLPLERSIRVDADESRSLDLDLPAEYGTVFVTSRPADAALTLDNKPAGTGTQRLRLTTREHVLIFSKTGFVPQTVTVTPQTGTSQNIDVTLKTLAQAKEDARPSVYRSASGQELRLLEPGDPFRMGASRREAGRRANENQRLVQLSRSFYLSSSEVTNGVYRQFNAKHNSGSAEGESLNADKLPVVNVSWDDAVRFCNWLSGLEKLPPAYEEIDGHMSLIPDIKTGYRLPSEAEWTYAARIAGQVSAARYPWAGGYPPGKVVGNFADAQIADTLADVVTGYNDGYRGPAPVGSFSSHHVGFNDLGGNVAEWTNDYYATYPGQVEKLVKDPFGPSSGDHHVVRGSSWRDGNITELRLSYRDYSRDPRDDLGFRIARYADE